MNQAHTATAGRAATFVAGLATLIMAAGTFPDRTSAQQGNSTTGFAPAPLDQAPPPPAVDTQPRMQAPIGHRQPRPQDLPAGMARDEGARTPEQRDLDEKLQICRGC